MNEYKIVVSIINQNFFNKINEFTVNNLEECLRIVDTQKIITKQDSNHKIDITVLYDNQYLFNIEV